MRPAQSSSSEGVRSGSRGEGAEGRERVPTGPFLRAQWESSKRNPELIMHIMQLPKPVIAAVNGWCIGGGFWYSLACDISIASERAVFAQSEVRMISNSTVLFAMLAGWKVAHRYSLTGDHVDAQEALRIGVVNDVVPHEELMPRARAFAERLAPDVAHLEAARKEGGFRAFLEARDKPFLPEPFGPRSDQR